MKIGKLTLDGYNNYGNTLQNYALQQYLLNYAECVDTIFHSPEEKLSEFWQWGSKERIKFLLNYKAFRSEMVHGIKAWELARRVRCYDFQQEYIHNRYNVQSLADVVNDYDFFIVGSDQVWNPDNPRLKTAFLEFAPSSKRISFAASIGADRISDEKKYDFIQGINGMKAISVREKRAAELIFELTGKEVDVILDPVFCLTAEQWRTIARKPVWYTNEPYILTYFLGSIPQAVYEIKKTLGLKIINIFDQHNFDYYNISPSEWLYLFEHAELIYTDSFHATAFSIIFQKPFITCEREGNEHYRRMKTRIESLLEIFKMDYRFASKTNRFLLEDILNVDFKNVASIIDKELNKVNKFFVNAVSYRN